MEFLFIVWEKFHPNLLLKKYQHVISEAFHTWHRLLFRGSHRACVTGLQAHAPGDERVPADGKGSPCVPFTWVLGLFHWDVMYLLLWLTWLTFFFLHHLICNVSVSFYFRLFYNLVQVAFPPVLTICIYWLKYCIVFALISRFLFVYLCFLTFPPFGILFSKCQENAWILCFRFILHLFTLTPSKPSFYKTGNR